MTSFTAQSVIDLARSLWREQVADDIMDDAKALLWVNQAVIKIRSRRPESMLDDNGNVQDYAGGLAVGTTIPLDVKFQLACAYFLTAHGFGRSADQQNLDKRFGDWMGLFEKEIAQA